MLSELGVRLRRWEQAARAFGFLRLYYPSVVVCVSTLILEVLSKMGPIREVLLILRCAETENLMERK